MYAICPVLGTVPVTGDKAMRAILCVLSEETCPSTIIRVLKLLSELDAVKYH